MNVICENREGRLYIKPEGRLDSNSTGEFEEILMSSLDDSVEALTIDMQEVDFISSKGLRAVVSAYKKMNGKEITLDNVNTAVNEVFKLSGMLGIFKVNKQ